MLKRRASLLHFLRILEACWQARVLGELLTDQRDLLKVIYGTRAGAIFSNILHFAACLHYQQRKLHALSPPPAARYALGGLYSENRRTYVYPL